MGSQGNIDFKSCDVRNFVSYETKFRTSLWPERFNNSVGRESEVHSSAPAVVGRVSPLRAVLLQASGAQRTDAPYLPSTRSGSPSVSWPLYSNRTRRSTDRLLRLA